MNKKTLEWINETLHNDEASTDEELVAWFIEEGKLSEADARKAVSQRQACMMDFLYEVSLSKKCTHLPVVTRKTLRGGVEGIAVYCTDCNNDLLPYDQNPAHHLGTCEECGEFNCPKCSAAKSPAQTNTFIRKLPFLSQIKSDPEATFACCIWRCNYNACECCDATNEDLSGGSYDFFGDDDPNAPVFCKAHWDKLHDEKTGQSKLIPIQE